MKPLEDKVNDKLQELAQALFDMRKLDAALDQTRYARSVDAAALKEEY